ncbi:tRNA uridine(34) 5-carboxymethylaminomethyl modification radical SAM/GNAT enzyme Elp3 [bacterium]|nr:tRNA uridine(34) 5-carboxymethylaminomethyl modification radical SAM/GNAT enzyme Elp3 [bacterium]
MNIYTLTIKELIAKRVKNSEDLNKIKREVAKKLHTPLPQNIELLKEYHNLVKKKRIKPNKILEKILRKRPIRTLSGVAVVSLFTKPYPCPGKCIFCPQEKDLPKSYLRGEPAAERALKLKFDPFLQIKKRVESLEKQGHPTDKIEVRVIGASFSFYPKDYKVWFFANIFAAANNRERLKKANLDILKKEQKINERAQNRIVGISIETRPDLLTKEEVLLMRKLGITMVEIGVQTVFDDILQKCKRGHGTKEIIQATKILKDAGFKVMYQMMPNLPGSDLNRDLFAFKEIFENQNYKPDWLKIYPCLVCKGTELYRLWKKGEYKPYSDKELIDLLIEIKRIVPYWTRIARLFRDIPAPQIKAGSKISNLREVVQEEMKKKGLKCHCIRCREIKERYSAKEKIYLFQETYQASDGKEIFLSFENKNKTKLYAFLRLRIPADPFIKVLRNSSVIRELHTYGQMIPLEKKGKAPQHRGLGKKLIKEAEKITKKLKLKKIAVISGVGVREYYRKLGYRLKDTYMVKNLN